LKATLHVINVISVTPFTIDKLRTKERSKLARSLLPPLPIES